MVTALFDAIGYRDLVEIRGWAEELADDPALAAHPHAAAVLGTAAEAAYHRGDHPRAERLARAGLERATDERREVVLPGSAGGGRSWPAGRTPRSSSTASPQPRSPAGPPRPSGIAALASAYAGDPDEARALNERAHGGATSPSHAGLGRIRGRGDREPLLSTTTSRNGTT